MENVALNMQITAPELLGRGAASPNSLSQPESSLAAVVGTANVLPARILTNAFWQSDREDTLIRYRARLWKDETYLIFKDTEVASTRELKSIPLSVPGDRTKPLALTYEQAVRKLGDLETGLIFQNLKLGVRAKPEEHYSAHETAAKKPVVAAYAAIPEGSPAVA